MDLGKPLGEFRGQWSPPFAETQVVIHGGALFTLLFMLGPALRQPEVLESASAYVLVVPGVVWVSLAVCLGVLAPFVQSRRCVTVYELGIKVHPAFGLRSAFTWDMFESVSATKYSLVLIAKASRRRSLRIPWPVYLWFDCVDCVAAAAGAHHGLTRAMVRWAEANGHSRDLSRFVVSALNGEVASGPGPTRANPTSIYR